MANPIIRLEVMQRFRSPAGAWGIPIMVLLPGLAVSIIYAATLSSSRPGGVEMMGPDGMMVAENVAVQQGVVVGSLQGIGIGMFVAVIVTMLLALMVMVPGLIGGSIAGERQNQTLQPLQLTAITPTQIVVGKLVASLGYLVLVLVCAAPALTIPFLLGGLTVGQVLGSFGVLVFITVEFAAIALAASAIMSRPVPAILVALGGCVLITVGPWIVTGMAFILGSQSDPGFDAGTSALRYLASFSPVALGSWVVGLGNDDLSFATRNGDRILSLAAFVGVTIGALLIARRKVVAPVERDR